MPGSVPDITAARLLDIAGAAALHSVVVYADKGYIGLGCNLLGEPTNSVCCLSKIYRTTTDEVKVMNKIIAQVRWRVETVFSRGLPHLSEYCPAFSPLNGLLYLHQLLKCGSPG